MYLAVRKCKNDCETPKITLVPDFFPLNPEIARFSSGFRLNLPKQFKEFEVFKNTYLSYAGMKTS